MKKLLITLTLITVNTTHPNFFHGLERDIEAVAKAAPKIKRDIKAGRKIVKQDAKALKSQAPMIGTQQKTTKAITQKPKKK